MSNRHYNANSNKGVERYAIAAFVQYGVRMHVPLSAPARRELQRIRSSRAGLVELEAARTVPRNPFESVVQHTARELQVRTDARALQLAVEMQVNS